MIQSFAGTAVGVNSGIIQFMADTAKNINISQKGVADLSYTMGLFGGDIQKNTKKAALWASSLQALGIPAQLILKDIANASNDV